MNEVNKTQTDQSDHVGIEMVVMVVLGSLRWKFDPRDPVTSAPDRRHASQPSTGAFTTRPWG